MQGRQGQGDSGKDRLDRSPRGDYDLSARMEKFRETGGTGAYRLSELTGTGRVPAVPPRPRDMVRVDQPPPTPRVARPQKQRRQRGPKTWKWWAGAGCVSVVALIVVGMLVYAATNFFLAINASAGPANVATDFLSNLENANYDQAYDDLDTTLIARLSRSDFKQAALADDHCYGQVTNYSEVAGSAVTSTDGNVQSFTYTITRSKLTKTYQVQLTLQKDNTGGWNITSYGSDLGPAPPTCK